MKIYFIGQKGIPAKSGGVEKHVEELSSRLARAGHEVFVYTRLKYTGKNLKKYQGVNLINLPNIATKHLDAISHTFRACWDLRKREVDIIHFHSIGPASLIWLAKLLKPGVPVIFTFHTKCYTHKKWGLIAKAYLRFGELSGCLLADKTIVISRQLVQYTKAMYNTKAAYIPNGVSQLKAVKAANIKKWGLEKDNYILLVSRLVGHKGVHYLIEAYKQLKTNKKLVITGDGAYTDKYVKELKTRAQGNKNIIFTGDQTGRTLAELFSNAYLFVQPSESEGLSIALLEAMSYGKCVLYSDIPENQEAAAGAGYSFVNKNIASLKNKLKYLLNHPDRVLSRGESGRARVKEYYNWNNITKEVIGVYKNAGLAQPAGNFILAQAKKLIGFKV